MGLSTKGCPDTFLLQTKTCTSIFKVVVISKKYMIEINISYVTKSRQTTTYQWDLGEKKYKVM